jgi:hypothetical protein
MALTAMALQQPDIGWKKAALTELEPEILIDPTSAALLAPAITFELDLNQTDFARYHYQMFKRVARESPLNALVRSKP